MFRPTPFQRDDDRFYYEPRALWSVGRVNSALPDQTAAKPAGFLTLPKEDFKNPSRYPIRITHACISPVGYLFANWVAQNPNKAAQYDQAMSSLGRMRIAIAFPKRSWIERVNTDVMSFGTVPTADLEPALDRRSGLFGISRWTFPESYLLPRKASIEIILSTISTYRTDDPQVDVPACVIVHERGGRMLGHGRWRRPAPLEYAPNVAVAGAAWPAGQTPIVGDFFANLNNLVANPQGQVFPPSQKWPSSDYNRQLGSRGLDYTEVQGFGVHIDQIDYDDALDKSVNGPGDIAPIAQRIITKGRTRDAGTGEQWWRDGAPLSLVTPTMTPAFVHKFAQPFELGPGEGIEVGLQPPPPRTVQPPDADPIIIASSYNVGVSFCGYAVVQDDCKKVYR